MKTAYLREGNTIICLRETRNGVVWQVFGLAKTVETCKDYTFDETVNTLKSKNCKVIASET